MYDSNACSASSIKNVVQILNKRHFFVMSISTYLFFFAPAQCNCFQCYHFSSFSAMQMQGLWKPFSVFYRIFSSSLLHTTEVFSMVFLSRSQHMLYRESVTVCPNFPSNDFFNMSCCFPAAQWKALRNVQQYIVVVNYSICSVSSTFRARTYEMRPAVETKTEYKLFFTFHDCCCICFLFGTLLFVFWLYSFLHWHCNSFFKTYNFSQHRLQKNI